MFHFSKLKFCDQFQNWQNLISKSFDLKMSFATLFIHAKIYFSSIFQISKLTIEINSIFLLNKTNPIVKLIFKCLILEFFSKKFVWVISHEGFQILGLLWEMNWNSSILSKQVDDRLCPCQIFGQQFWSKNPNFGFHPGFSFLLLFHRFACSSHRFLILDAKILNPHHQLCL